MLNGESALVTGSTSGIGLGIARALAVPVLGRSGTIRGAALPVDGGWLAQ